MSIPEGFEPYRMQAFRGHDYFRIRVYRSWTNGRVDYTTRIQQTMIQSIHNRNMFGILYRVELAPRQWTVRHSWWSSDSRITAKHRVTTTANMSFSRYTILAFAPRSVARDTNGSVAIGAGGLGIALDFSIRDLTVTALTDTGVSDFGAIYSFSTFSPFSRTTSSHLGGFIFEHKEGNSNVCRCHACMEFMRNPRVTISHEVSYISMTFGLSARESVSGNWGDSRVQFYRETVFQSTRVHRHTFGL